MQSSVIAVVVLVAGYFSRRRIKRNLKGAISFLAAEFRPKQVKRPAVFNLTNLESEMSQAFQDAFAAYAAAVQADKQHAIEEAVATATADLQSQLDAAKAVAAADESAANVATVNAAIQYLASLHADHATIDA